MRRLRDRLPLDGATDVDDVVSDDGEADPAVHSDVALVAATTEAVLAFDHADALLASGAPFLTLTEPTFLCSRLRSALLVERLGMQTRLTPVAFAAASFLRE